VVSLSIIYFIHAKCAEKDDMFHSEKMVSGEVFPFDQSIASSILVDIDVGKAIIYPMTGNVLYHL